jgi:hypothetical protein
MSRRRSPIVGKRYPLRTVCEVWRVPRSSVYALTTVPIAAPAATKRGPKTAQSDSEIVALIREILATSPFHSEGQRLGPSRSASAALAVLSAASFSDGSPSEGGRQGTMASARRATSHARSSHVERTSSAVRRHSALGREPPSIARSGIESVP